MSGEFAAAYILLAAYYVIGFVVAWPYFTRKFYDWSNADDYPEDYFFAGVAGLLGGLLWPVVLVAFVVVPLFFRYLFGDR